MLGDEAGNLSETGIGARSKRGVRRAPGSWNRFLREPRSTVLFVLAAVLLAGGGRRLFQFYRARNTVGKLDEDNVTPKEIEAAADHGRAGLISLFRLLDQATSAPQRLAAAHALSILWARDELISEEEKALVRRGYSVDWKARKRYPRALRGPIPIVATFGVSFLNDDGRGVTPANLEWSYRLNGTKRASLENFGPWVAGTGLASFTIVPADFLDNGPHRIALIAKVRTVGLTDSWEIELPHMPFSFEFDPLIDVASLLTLPDQVRGEEIGRSIRLVGSSQGGPDLSPYLPLNDEMAIRDAPSIEVKTPLPSDLSHSIELEIEGVDGWFSGGKVTLPGQLASVPPGLATFSIGPVARLPAGAIDRRGTRKLRVRLLADPDRGWSEPEVRSVWPGTIDLGTFEIDIIRL